MRTGANLRPSPSPRATPGTDLSKPGVEDCLVKIGGVTGSGEVLQGLSRGKGREIELEVGAGLTWMV